MKKQIRIILSLILFASTAFSQIPNPSFEFWTNSIPVDWTINSQPTAISVSQSTDAYAGTYAIKGQVVNFNSIAYPPQFYTSPVSGPGFTLTTSPADLTGWCKANFIGNDVGVVTVYVYDSTSSIIAIGTGYLGSSAVYTQFTIPIPYFSGGSAAYGDIQFDIVDTSGTTSGTIGSNMLIDDLAFTGTSSINTISTKSFSVQPNPASDQINIGGDFKSGEVYHVTIFNTVGKIVLNSSVKATPTGLPAIDISSIPEGNYLISIIGADKSHTQKMLISR